MLDHKLCVFCNGEKNTELGDLISKDELSVHTLCLFSASKLGQHGSSDKDGLLGFWIEDIKQTLEHSQNNNCEYCDQIGATVFCAECQVKFHYTCGKENLCITELFDNFTSYCQDHRPRQKLPLSFSSECPLCDGFCDPTDSFFLSCCDKSWIHTKCVQNEADQLGADGLSCPLCKSKSEFIEVCQRFGGVFIRRKVLDETNSELQVKPNECSKPKCCCPYGLSYSDDHRYRFWLCTKCQMFKIHQSCREAKDYPNYVCILCVRGKAGMSKFAVRKVGGNPSVRVDTVTSIIYPDSSGIKLEESLVKKEESEENGGKDSEEFAKKRSPRKHRSSRNRPDVGFDAEFSDISSADDETAFEKEERENSRSRRHRDRSESDLPAQEKVVVEGKHEISKPIVNQFHPAIRDLTKPPKGTKFTTRRNAVGGQFMPRPPNDGQQKKEPMNLIKLDPQTILGLASSGNPANIEKAEELLHQLTNRFGGFTGNKATIALNSSYNAGNLRGNQNYEENKSYNRDRGGRGGDRFEYKGNWGGKHDNRGGDHRRGHGGWDHRRDDKSFHRNNQPFRQGRSGDKHRSKSREHDDRRGSRDRRYDSNRNRRYEQYINSSPKQTTPPKEKPNLAHVPKSLVDHVVRDIEKEAAAKAEAEEKMRTEAIEAKKRIEEELRQIQEEEDAKRREKEEKKAAVAAGGWKPLGESESAGKGTKSDEEPEEGEAEDSGDDGESSSSSSSSDSDSSSEDAGKKGSGNEGTGEDESDENKRPDVSKLLEIEPEPEVELTEEEQLINLQRFSEQANEYKKRFRSLEDSIRKLHTDVVFYAERCDQDMIQGVQSQCNLYNLEINKLFQFCKEMKPFATAEGTKIQINTFVIKIGDAETELKKARGVVDEFAQLIERISILEELLVEQIKEEALIVEPIMKDLRTQPKVLLDKVRSDIESALADSTDNPKSLHRNYEQFVNKLNSMLRDGDVKLDKVASLEASVMEHQENLGKHLKELRFELNDRNNLKSYVDEIAKLLTTHKTTAEHVESTKSHPDRAMSCIQSLRKEYKRLSKATDKYRVKYSSANLELPDGMEEILYNLKETKAKLEIELEQLVTKCEGWKKEAAPLLASAFGGGSIDGKSGDDSSDTSKRKGFGFQLKLSDETQKVIKDGNQLLKAQSSTAEQDVTSDSSDSEEKTSGNRSEDELSTKIPDYLAPLPKPIDHNPQPIMPLPAVTTSVPLNSLNVGAPVGTLLPPVPPQMPNVPVPPTFQPPFMSMPVVPPPMFSHPQMQMPPAFVPPMGQQNPMNPATNVNFPPPPGIPIQFSPQVPPSAPYMPPPQQVTFSAAPSLIQAQPMHYGPNATQPHMHSIPQSPSIQASVMSLPVSSAESIIASDVVSSLPDSSLIEAAAKALENVAAVSSLESGPVKTKASSESQKKKKKRKKNEDADSDIEAIESFPKPQSLDLSSVSINLSSSMSPENSVNELNSAAKELPETEASTLEGLSRKAKKDRRRKYRKGGFQDEYLEESEETQLTQEVQYPEEKNSKKPSAFSYAAAMVGLNSDVLNADETYDPAEPTIVNYNHAVDTNSYEVVYRPEQADFVLVQKNSDAAAAVHAQQQQVSDALTKSQKDTTSDAEELDEESLKKKEQIKKDRKERKKAQKEALKKERELEREEELKQGKKSSGKSGPISSMLSILSHLDENKNEQQEEKSAEKEDEIIEPITCIQINSTSPTAKDTNSNKLRPDVKLSPQVVNSTTGSISPTPVSSTHEASSAEKSGKGNVSPFMSNKVTSSQPALESELLLQPTSRSEPEDGEEEEGEVNSDEEVEVRSPTVKDKDKQVVSPPVLQDKQVNSSVCNVPSVSFSQEEATSTIADETLLKLPGLPQLHQTQSMSTTSTFGDPHRSMTSTGAKMEGTVTGHVISFAEESEDEQSNEEKGAVSASSEDEQPSLVPSQSGKSKKVTSMVPPPPPERKRNKKKGRKVAESSSTSTDDDESDDSSSSSSEEEPQLTKKQLKKMMKFYALFAKSKGSSKSKKKTKKRKKSNSVDEESSDEETPVKQKKSRRHSHKKNADTSDSEDSTDLVTPKKKVKKSKSAKSTPSSGSKQASKNQPENQQNTVADDSDEISMSSFFNQDDSIVSSVIDAKTSKSAAKKQNSSPTILISPQLLTPEDAIQRFLPEFSSDSNPPISALSRHFSPFWELFPVETEKEAALARQIAIGLLETAINYNQEGKTAVPIQTQMVLTMLKNMKSW